MLSLTDLKKITTAIQNNSVIEITYYPQQSRQRTVSNLRLTGIRRVVPLQIFSKGGINYLLAYFLTGASLSGGFGYRLYFLKSINKVNVTTNKMQLAKLNYQQVNLLWRKKEID